MIVYSNTKGGFVDDVRNGIIVKKIIEEFNKHNVKHHNDAEYRAWSNSLVHMRNALDDIEISDEEGTEGSGSFDVTVDGWGEYIDVELPLN